MSELIQKFQCPHCFVSVPMPERDEAVTCSACGATLAILQRLCADCGTYHEAEVAFCATCAAPMTQVCRRCRTLNWAGNGRCSACGAGLDVIETLAHHSTEGSTAVAQQQMNDAHKIKWLEALSSAERMAVLNEKEAARLVELHRREQIIQRQTRQMWVKTAVAVALIILIVLAVSLLS
jgi:hypothetical protein